MAPRFAWCWTCCGGDDPSSRERARLPVSESVRYAAQFRWPPHAGAGPPAVGCLRRPSLFIRLAPQGPAKNYVLGHGRIRDMGETFGDWRHADRSWCLPGAYDPTEVES